MHKKILAAVMLIGGSNVSHTMQTKEPFIVGDTLRIPFTTKNNRISLYEFKLPYKKTVEGYLCRCFPVLTSESQEPHHLPEDRCLSEETLCKLLSAYIKNITPGDNLVAAFVKKIKSQPLPKL